MANKKENITSTANEKVKTSSQKIKPAAETKPSVDVQKMIDELAEKADKALHAFMKLEQDQVDKIVNAMALAGLDHHRELAKLAIEETKRGIYEDKVIKNMFSTEYIWHSIKKEKTVISFNKFTSKCPKLNGIIKTFRQ